jgi:hypothetical protein
LSNACKDYLRDYEQNNRPPFRIKYWERPILDKLAEGNTDLLDRYMLRGTRSLSEIIAAEEEFLDRRWYERHLMRRYQIDANGLGDIDPKLWERALAAAASIEAQRPDMGPAGGDFEWACGAASTQHSAGSLGTTGTTSTPEREREPDAGSPSRPTPPRRSVREERAKQGGSSRMLLLRTKEPPQVRGFSSAPKRIRTSDLRFRRPTLYPAELWAQRLPV